MKTDPNGNVNANICLVHIVDTLTVSLHGVINVNICVKPDELQKEDQLLLNKDSHINLTYVYQHVWIYC